MNDFERLNIILAARDREFARAMERNQRRVERFAKQSQRNLSKTSKSFDALGMAAKRMAPLLAALGAGAVIGKLKATVASLDEIGKTADKLGVTTDALQELRTIAESEGIGQGALDSSLERLNKRLGEAQQGTGAAAKMLERLGLEADKLALMGLDDALGVIADRISALPQPTERAAAAAALFGREGVAMVNLLRRGSDGMDQMRQEARDLGIVLDENLVRGAEEAQNKLDLMGRVISAQLNSALIDLAPYLVAAATGIADMARALNSGIEAVQNFLNPQTELQKATDNVVLAMADEIRQSQMLDQALGRGITMSQATAKAKLEEARTRHENAKAALAEQRALVLNSSEWSDLTEQMHTAQDALNATGFHGDKVTLKNAEAYEAEQARLASLITRRQDLLKQNEELQAQLERTGKSVATLEAAIGTSGGGLISIDGPAVNPIETGARSEITATGTSAAAAIPELSDYADVMARLQKTFGETAAAGDGYNQTLTQLEAMRRQGILSEKEHADALATVEDQFNRARGAADSLRDASAQTFASIITRSNSAADAVANLAASLSGQFATAAFKGLTKSSGVFDFFGGLLSFDGGGDTPGGLRAGGVDGKGGFPAILHPGETVIDHTKAASRAAGPAATNINVNVSGARGNAEIRDMVEAGVRQGLDQNNRTVLPRLVGQINKDPRRIG